MNKLSRNISIDKAIESQAKLLENSGYNDVAFHSRGQIKTFLADLRTSLEIYSESGDTTGQIQRFSEILHLRPDRDPKLVLFELFYIWFPKDDSLKLDSMSAFNGNSRLAFDFDQNLQKLPPVFEIDQKLAEKSRKLVRVDPVRRAKGTSRKQRLSKR